MDLPHRPGYVIRGNQYIPTEETLLLQKLNEEIAQLREYNTDIYTKLSDNRIIKTDDIPELVQADIQQSKLSEVLSNKNVYI